MPDANGKLSMEELLTQAAGGTIEPTKPTEPTVPAAPNPDPTSDPTPNPDPTSNPDPTPNPTPNPTSTTTEPNPTPDPKTGDPKTGDPKAGDPKPNPMKEIRDKYNTEKSTREKIDGAIQRFTNGDYSFKLKDFVVDGKMDYDGLIKAMEDADVKVKADSKGISPEVQAELDRIEKEKIEIEKQKLQLSMDRALTNLQLDMNIKGNEINNFFKDAMAANKNPYRWLAQGGDLHDLYNLIYRDKLIQSKVDEAVAAARTKWEEENKRQNKVPVANPAQPLPQSNTNSNGLSLNDMLEEAAKKVYK